MGSEKDDKEAFENERPARDVTLSPFCIDIHEVTVAKYRECAGEERGGLRCPPAPTTVEWSEYSEAQKKMWSAYCNGDRRDRDDHPINCADWTMADTYCRWAGGSLPTEAQWEYAARGSDRRQYPWGNEPPDPTRLNGCGQECRAMLARDGNPGARVMYEKRDGWSATAPVGQFPAGKSPFGALDMAGNVWEWVLDKDAPYDPSKLADPVQTEGTQRVLRGVSWDYGSPRGARAAFRGSEGDGERYSDAGFRCARQQAR
jgi:formylglycine-generating enzyme required for sulfatase activity